MAGFALRFRTILLPCSPAMLNNALIYNNSIVRLCGIVTCSPAWLTRNFTLQNNTAHNEGNDTDRTRLREVPRVHNRGNCSASSNALSVLTLSCSLDLAINVRHCFFAEELYPGAGAGGHSSGAQGTAQRDLRQRREDIRVP